MATMYERNGVYYVNYSVNGRRVRKAISKDEREANLLFKELKYKLFKGDIKPEKPEFPIDYFFDKYLKNCQMRLAERTCTRYQNAIKHFRKYFTVYCSIQNISQVNKGALQQYILYRQDSKPKPKSKTINMELAVLRSALNWALDNDWIENSPANRLKLLRNKDSKSGKALTKEEVEALLRGCETLRDGKWFKNILITFLNTGMRRGELTNLTWDDIDWEQNLILIQEKPFWSPKTYERYIPINHTVECVLGTLRASKKGIFVFNRNGRKIRDRNLRQRLITLSNRVGLPHLTRIHDFRHTFCSNLLMAGVDIPTVQSLLGHKSWNTTLIYSHQTREHTRKAVQML